MVMASGNRGEGRKEEGDYVQIVIPRKTTSLLLLLFTLPRAYNPISTPYTRTPRQDNVGSRLPVYFILHASVIFWGHENMIFSRDIQLLEQINDWSDDNKTVEQFPKSSPRQSPITGRNFFPPPSTRHAFKRRVFKALSPTKGCHRGRLVSSSDRQLPRYYASATLRY